MDNTILIVDDSVSLRQVLSFTLKGEGYHVIEAVDGVDALEKLKGENTRLVITDLNMPNMDGIELIRTLRQEKLYRFIPIIMLTTESSAEKKTLAREAGATGWITKPFRPPELLAVIRKILA